MPLTSARGTPPRGCHPATPTARNAGLQERTLWGWCWVPTPTPPTPRKQGQWGLAAHPTDGQPGEGERLTSEAPHHGDRSQPGATPRHNPRRATPPTGHARQRDNAGSPCPHTRAHGKWATDPSCPPQGHAAGGGQASNPRRPSQRREAAPLGTPSRHSHNAQRRLLRVYAVGPVLGHHTHTTRARDTLATKPACPPRGRTAWRGRAPEIRRPSQR